MQEKTIAKFIGIAGPQGSGKGTTIDALQNLNSDLIFLFDDFKVSRHVQKVMGFSSLQEATDTFEKMICFQNRILEEKANSLSFLRNAMVDFVITERTFVDIATYFQLWCIKMVQQGTISQDQCNDVVEQFSQKSFNLQHKFFDTTIIIPMMDHVAFEQDPNRADEKDVDIFYNLFMENVGKCGCECILVSSEGIVERAKEIECFLKTGESNGKI